MAKHLASALCLAAGLSIYAFPSLAQNDDRFPSDADAKERAACTPDVRRLCNDYVPVVADIVACLRREHAQLSPACAEVFAVPEACKADIPRLCKDYLVVIPSVVACLKQAQGNLSAACTQAMVEPAPPAPVHTTTAPPKKPKK